MSAGLIPSTREARIPCARANEDSHFLRTDLGRVPNVEDRGSGWATNCRLRSVTTSPPGWSTGAGVRYWYTEVNGTSEFVNLDVKVPLDDFTSERFGVYGDVSYWF
jgi:hypothetical protein